MYIEILHDTLKHKVGDKYDEEINDARFFIRQGYARQIPRSPDEEAKAAASAGSTVVPNVPLTWLVNQHPINQEIQVIRKCGFETTYYSAPPKDCPEFRRG
jgi:hypothetical protein